MNQIKNKWEFDRVPFSSWTGHNGSVTKRKGSIGPKINRWSVAKEAEFVLTEAERIKNANLLEVIFGNESPYYFEFDSLSPRYFDLYSGQEAKPVSAQGSVSPLLEKQRIPEAAQGQNNLCSEEISAGTYGQGSVSLKDWV